MLKCILIYLWIYIGLFYMIEAGDDNEHVHIKLHMTSGQRKRAQIQQHTHKHQKKRQTPSSSHHHHHHHHHQQQQAHPLTPPIATTSTTNLYHESPHNYLTGITATTSSLLPQQQHHIFQPTHTKKFPFPSSSPLNLPESGQLLNVEEDVFGAQGDIGGDAAVSADADAGEQMMIPSYLAKNFALFPQPTTTYETEIIPHNSEGFNMVREGSDGLEDLEEDNEISASVGRGKGNLESILLAGQMENYQRHKPSSTSSSAKTIKNEQLLQQLLQQQHNENQEIMNAAAYKSAKLRGNKHRAEKDYFSEDDMTEAVIYTPSSMGTRHNPAHTLSRPADDAAYSGSIKALTVDDIWSQLQKQYLNKYAPHAQAITSEESDEQAVVTTAVPAKIKHKRKRNIKRQRFAKPTTASFSTSWPAKSLSYANHNHHKHQIHPNKQLQQYYDDIHSPPSAAAFSSASLSSHRDADLFIKRPHIKLTGHHNDDDTEVEADEDTTAGAFGEGGGDDDFDVQGDNSFEENVYQSGKNFKGHSAYGQRSHTRNPFNYHDLFGSYSTPVTATVATNIQPSTYHPNLLSSTLPSYTASAATITDSFIPTLSHPSTSYQWRTEQNYPASYQTYHLQHQEQQPQWTATTGRELYDQQQSSVLRLPKATIAQTPNAILSSKLSPTQSNDFTVLTSTSSSAKSGTQAPTRYKKRKNRIKPKRNRIVVI